jgi:hypothetical protein
MQWLNSSWIVLGKCLEKSLDPPVALIYTVQHPGGIMEIAILLLSVALGGGVLAAVLAYTMYVLKK